MKPRTRQTSRSVGSLLYAILKDAAKRCPAALAGLVMCASAFAAELPNYTAETYAYTIRAISAYEEIVANGGWPQLPPEAAGLKIGARSRTVEILRQRLAMSGDLDASIPLSPVFDQATEDALKHFQARHGLSQTGSVGRLTMAALNISAEQRLLQLDASATRLTNLKFNFGKRYIVSNIPAATLEAVEDGALVRSYTTVVGTPERASPTLQTNVTAVNILPYWHVPRSILKADIIPKMIRNPLYLAENHMRIYRDGREVDPATIDWARSDGTGLLVKQDPGVWNSLGFVRIDMPNTQAVYMHDTPHREQFRFDKRFQSSGCTRVAGAQDLSAWLLEGSEWSGQAIQDQIDSGKSRTIRLKSPVPVAWIYLTGWGAPDGTVHFRPDVYSLDSPITRFLSSNDPLPGDTGDPTGSIPNSPLPPSTPTTRLLPVRGAAP